MFEPRLDTRVPDARHLESIASAWRDRAVVVVLDAGVVSAAGSRIDAAFAGASRVIRVIVPAGSPTPATVAPVEEAIVRSEADLVVAIGGGATLDAAKIARYAVEGASRPRLVAVPTTAGTGAEATHFAVLYVDGVKRSIAAPAVRPDLAVVDPSWLASTPGPVAAAAALDALVQAIESCISIRSTEGSRAAAARALDLLAPRLPDPTDHEGLGLAAFHAGDAIDVSFTGAAHALSYPFTARAGVPHGFAVAALLPPVLETLLDAGPDSITDPRGADFVRARLDEIATRLGLESATAVPERVRTIAAALGAGPLPAIDRGILHAEASAERLANTPVAFDRAMVDRVLDAAMGRI